MKKIYFLILLLALSVKSFGQWELTDFLATPTDWHSMVTLDGYTYAIGGQTSNALQRLDPSTGTWTLLAPIPVYVNGILLPAAAAANGKIYLFGGVTEFGIIYKVQVYDPATNSWSLNNDMPSSFYGGSAVAYGDKIYVFGGEPNGPTRDECLEYDITNDTWATKASMPEARSLFRSALIGDDIYAVGGKIDDVGIYSTTFVYNITTNTWSTKSSMSIPRVNLAVVALNGKIWALGGGDGTSSGATNSTEFYDPETDNWEAGPNLIFVRNGIDAAVLEECIYVAGGTYQGITIDFVERFCEVLSIEDINDVKAALIYPNPANGYFQVKFNIPVSINTKITLRDITGKLIQQYDTLNSENDILINTSHLNSGMYLLEIKDEINQILQIEKVLIN